eukprot:3671095-Rhodomonas_salina.6
MAGGEQERRDSGAVVVSFQARAVWRQAPMSCQEQHTWSTNRALALTDCISALEGNVGQVRRQDSPPVAILKRASKTPGQRRPRNS